MLDRNRLVFLAAGLVLGVLFLVAFRFAVAEPPEPTHYHANFAVWVNGERLDLSADQFMEDVGSCAAAGAVLPRERAHLHNNNADVAHVHDQGVTWGQLLANLGMAAGNDFLVVPGGDLYQADAGRTMKFILNGKPQFAVTNDLIRSGDRLLISFGPKGETEVLQTQFPAVAANAPEFNLRPDPASCSGAAEPTLWDRFRHAWVG